MLNETIEGGAFLAPDGKTFINANGEPVDGRDKNGDPIVGERTKAARKLAAEQQADMDAQDVQLLEAQALRDPVARALSGFVRQTATSQPDTRDAEIAALKAQLADAQKAAK